VEEIAEWTDLCLVYGEEKEMGGKTTRVYGHDTRAKKPGRAWLGGAAAGHTLRPCGFAMAR